ncbi:hypothetical protein ACFY8V_25015 [Streptomyces californicus]|uniref:hypothetical protein n=1 Tax=Streptomyces californicus TaxID=67351 RepID=UPI0036B069E5
MNFDPPDPDDPFGLVEQYDSIEDPDLRSEFLDAVGTTRSYINALRFRRDKAAARDASAPESSGAPKNRGPRRRVPRLRLRNRGTTGRPPRYAGSVRSKYSRNRARPDLVVIIFKLD